jgi:hypothetical protein
MILSVTKNLSLMVHNSLFMKKLPFWKIKSVNFVRLISSHMIRVFEKGNNNWVAEILSLLGASEIFLFSTRITVAVV